MSAFLTVLTTHSRYEQQIKKEEKLTKAQEKERKGRSSVNHKMTKTPLRERAAAARWRLTDIAEELDSLTHFLQRKAVNFACRGRRESSHDIIFLVKKGLS